jgi:hypothetical protein
MSATCILSLTEVEETTCSVRLFMHCKYMTRIVDVCIVNTRYDEHARRLQRRINSDVYNIQYDKMDSKTLPLALACTSH